MKSLPCFVDARLFLAQLLCHPFHDFLSEEQLLVPFHASSIVFVFLLDFQLQL